MGLKTIYTHHPCFTSCLRPCPTGLGRADHPSMAKKGPVDAFSGVDGVVEILKHKYECRKGERYRVIGERGGPGAGHWRLEKGKTIPKTHVKEGGWRWVLEEPEEETVVKPPPVATAPVETFTPKAMDHVARPSRLGAEAKEVRVEPSRWGSELQESDEEAESPRKKREAKGRELLDALLIPFGGMSVLYYLPVDVIIASVSCCGASIKGLQGAVIKQGWVGQAQQKPMGKHNEIIRAMLLPFK